MIPVLNNTRKKDCLVLSDQDKLSISKLTRDYPKLEELRKLYNSSFPDEERKSLEMILEGIDYGVTDALVFESGEKVAALAFMIPHEKLIILDYLAVHPALQNRNIGSRILNFLQSYYREPILVEIESSRNSVSDSPENRRKNFYLKNGLKDLGIDILLFGVPMELMATQSLSFSDYRKAFENYALHFHFMDDMNLDEKIILL